MFKGIKNTLVFSVILAAFAPQYASADAQKASVLRKKAIAAAVASGVSYWTILRGVPLFSFYTMFGPIGLACGIASSVYAHKLRMARKKELQNN